MNSKGTSSVRSMDRSKLQKTYSEQLNELIKRCEITKQHCKLWYVVSGASWCLHPNFGPYSWRCPEWKEEE